MTSKVIYQSESMILCREDQFFYFCIHRDRREMAPIRIAKTTPGLVVLRKEEKPCNSH